MVRLQFSRRFPSESGRIGFLDLLDEAVAWWGTTRMYEFVDETFRVRPVNLIAKRDKSSGRTPIVVKIEFSLTTGFYIPCTVRWEAKSVVFVKRVLGISVSRRKWQCFNKKRASILFSTTFLTFHQRLVTLKLIYSQELKINLESVYNYNRIKTSMMVYAYTRCFLRF